MLPPPPKPMTHEHRSDNRNETAHDYGEASADATLTLLPDFVADAYHLADVIEEKTGGWRAPPDPEAPHPGSSRSR